MNKDTIYRQMAIDAVNDLTYPSSLVDVKRKLVQLPSAQPERKTGHWEFQGYQMFSCTCCSYIASQEQLESWRIKETDSAFPLFCPNCGADMRGEENGRSYRQTGGD